ncbi:hypothetical protein NSK_008645 [Nannochloropsis salina CCMP1776]|uniref:Fibronectin type-III domain-containing protein n=1 Tax=Nannochloropsis salina CCMP1776 TaxID=1027361 RepID=A0A4D9CTQ9_9STRA|nr:hypothetical protein NSK_008645 [Nannochloropsis salina CCMP1776]|eukprot:TFJ80088.1 hypothetical protein NSK_008645 [Nannochloropsis salina CCMP1776]
MTPEVLLPPGEPRFVAAGDTSIRVEWDAIDTLRYRIQYKEYLQSWEEAAQVDVPSGQNRMVAALPDLQPCATYCVRLVAVDEDGLESPPGPEIFVDTQGKDGVRIQLGGK